MANRYDNSISELKASCSSRFKGQITGDMLKNLREVGVEAMFIGLKELFYKLGIYKQAKKYLEKPHGMYMGMRFRLNSDEAIKVFLNTMNEHSYIYWLEFGTLLGAIRENGLIPYDQDIDVAMYRDDWDEKMEEALVENGFKLIKRAKLLSGEIIEETYLYKTAQIDIFYASKGDTKIKLYDYQTFNNLSPNECIKRYGGLKVYENCLTCFDLKDYTFFEIDTKVPSNYVEHLIELYNEDYMIPNKDWSFDASKVRKETNLLASVEYF